MKRTLLACAALFAFTCSANAALVVSASQNTAPSPTVIATDDGLVTHINITNADTNITTGLLGALPSVFFSMTATSIDAATTLGTLVFQHYNGTFCFTTAIGCGGTNLLSGVFKDAAFGALGGPGLTVNVNNPPDTLTLTSSVLAANLLQAPSTFDLSFANLGPALHVDGATIGAFTADFAGNVSASAAVVEPAGIALLGMGMLGLATVRRRSA